MAINTKGSKTDGNGWRVEQYYNPATDSYEAIEGSDGAANMKLTGSNVEQATGQSLPSKAVLMGAANGANMQNLLVQSGSYPNLRMALYSDSEPWRNNTEGTLLASAARTASATSPQQTNHNAKGVIVFLDVTAVSGTGGLTVIIHGTDPTSGKQIDLLISNSITTLGRYAFELYPGSSTGGTAGNAKVNTRVAGSLPRKWDVLIYNSDGTSYTYSTGYSLIV
jgi:hypothetical protein